MSKVLIVRRSFENDLKKQENQPKTTLKYSKNRDILIYL